jgi:DNA-binding NarL/FixJ family response regulator
MRTLLARAVRAAGHEVAREAHDAPSAIEAARAERADVLILDSRLPPGGACNAIAAIREAAPRTALLVLASLDERAIVREAVAAGARGPIVRPVRPGVVAEMLNALAGESRE